MNARMGRKMISIRIALLGEIKMADKNAWRRWLKSG
jgi:hypothetical protein